MKRIRLLAASALCVLLPNCGLGPVVQGVANAPTQVVMVHAVPQPGATGVTTKVFPLPPDGGRLAFGVSPWGGISPFQYASRIAPPGIAANNDLYVVAYWGGVPPTVSALRIFVSENGRRWSYAGGFPLLLPTQDPGLNGRPAITFFPNTGTWFVAFRNPANGAILVEQFRIDCVYSGDRCSYEPDGRTVFAATRLAATPGPGVSSLFAPALAYVGQELILAHWEPSGVMIQKSADGVSWTPAPGVVATTGGAPLNTHDAPYLNNTFGELWLATTLASGTSGAIDVFLFSSPDGLAWTQQSRFTTGGGSSRYPAAVAGNTSDRIFAFPGPNNQGVEYAIGPATSTFTLALGQIWGVSLAKGAGPTAVETQPCAQGQSLIARTASGDVPGPNHPGFGVHPVAFGTSGAFALICTPPSSSRRVCSSSTRWATIRKPGPGPNYVIECWTRNPDSGP